MFLVIETQHAGTFASVRHLRVNVI